jgi:hypothetical protein
VPSKQPYVVGQGDYLLRIAHRLGFDPDVVWQDDVNSSLRQLRKDPNIRCPTDVLFVPTPKDPPSHQLVTGSTNTFMYGLHGPRSRRSSRRNPSSRSWTFGQLGAGCSCGGSASAQRCKTNSADGKLPVDVRSRRARDRCPKARARLASRNKRGRSPMAQKFSSGGSGPSVAVMKTRNGLSGLGPSSGRMSTCSAASGRSVQAQARQSRRVRGKRDG